MAKLCQSVDRHAERKHAEQLLAECEGAKVASVHPVPTHMIDFWASSTCDPQVMTALGLKKLRPSARGRVHRFVSHCWSAPPDFAQGTVPQYAATTHQDVGEYAQRAYAKCKAAELLRAARTVSSELYGNQSEWDRVTLWLDKVCVPQHDPAKKAEYIASLEEFLHLSDGLIVLLSWNYFSRLWCLYEWACFLVSHPATMVCVRMVPFPNLENQRFWIDAVANLRVEKAACFDPRDREVLFRKVGQYYRGASIAESCKSFERFVQFSAVALLATHMAEFITEKRLLDMWFTPWLDLAKRLNFPGLVRALQQLAAPADLATHLPVVCYWHFEAVQEGDPAFFHRRLSIWFAREVFPLLDAEKQRAVRPEALHLVAEHHDFAAPTAALEADPLCSHAAQRFFHHLDADHTGFVEKDEFLRVHDALCGRKGGMKIRQGVFASDKESLFRKIDLCEDGRIDADEWAYYASAALQSLGRRDFLRLLRAAQPTTPGQHTVPVPTTHGDRTLAASAWG
jgi:hypothetical protein